MTRINVIPVQELHPMHLRGEYKEIVRVFDLARKYHQRKMQGKKVSPLTTEYTLGTGHVLFFYDKLSYILNRYRSLTKEMIWNGYKVNPISCKELLKDIPQEYLNDYTPTPEAIDLNKQRIALRLNQYHTRRVA